MKTIANGEAYLKWGMLLVEQSEDVNIPIREEQVEVTKKPVETERIHVRSEEQTEQCPMSETLRKEDVNVTRE